MGIDRIGKGGGAPPTTGPGAAGPAAPSTGAERPFEVRAEKTGAARPADVVQGASPLQQLRAGEITLDRYLDLKVEQATSHLHGLTKVELETIRSTMRDQIAQDPTLADLVRQATGQVPKAPEE
jgi:hypothetical protein